eukprot:TRINITY_DN66870_c0_g1_i1.p1 TRINITY_DN66870_c0_g1~~TRINITY_DN66870_c0_g1_i1.p1  ORF type:complete len:396 (-),score=64.48 TRINITY_DN66870_c0_g1_i1:8-1195(-)
MAQSWAAGAASAVASSESIVVGKDYNITVVRQADAGSFIVHIIPANGRAPVACLLQPLLPEANRRAEQSLQPAGQSAATLGSTAPQGVGQSAAAAFAPEPLQQPVPPSGSSGPKESLSQSPAPAPPAVFCAQVAAAAEGNGAEGGIVLDDAAFLASKGWTYEWDADMAYGFWRNKDTFEIVRVNPTERLRKEAAMKSTPTPLTSKSAATTTSHATTEASSSSSAAAIGPVATGVVNSPAEIPATLWATAAAPRLEEQGCAGAWGGGLQGAAVQDSSQPAATAAAAGATPDEWPPPQQRGGAGRGLERTIPAWVQKQMQGGPGAVSGGHGRGVPADADASVEQPPPSLQQVSGYQQSQPPTPQPLPEGWMEYRCPDTLRLWWWHEETQRHSWERPT